MNTYSDFIFNHVDAWIGIAGAVIGGAVGSLLAFTLEMWRRRIEERKRKAEKVLTVFSHLKGLSYEVLECAEEALLQSFNYNYAEARKGVNVKFSGSPDDWARLDDESQTAF